MRWGLLVGALLAGVLFTAQSAPRERANVGPAANPTSGSATLEFLDAGTVWLGNGTVSLPSLAFGSQPNTGAFRSAANSVAIATNGSLGLTIDAAGITVPNGRYLALSAASPILYGGAVTFAGSTPTVSSGFGTSPSITAGKATAFRVNVGTGGSATSGVIALGTTATTGWNCTCTDITTATDTVYLCKQTANSTTTVTIGNFNTSGVAAAWVASDIVAVSCVGF